MIRLDAAIYPPSRLAFGNDPFSFSQDVETSIEKTGDVVVCYAELFLQGFGTKRGSGGPFQSRLLEGLNDAVQTESVQFGFEVRIINLELRPISYGFDDRRYACGQDRRGRQVRRRRSI